MPTPTSAWYWMDLSPQLAAADTAETGVAKPVPFEGTIKAVRVMQKENAGAAESGSFTLSKKTLNILSAASCDLQADLTTATVKELTLTTNKATLAVQTTDYITAVWLLTTCALTNEPTLFVAIEPGKDW